MLAIKSQGASHHRTGTPPFHLWAHVGIDVLESLDQRQLDFRGAGKIDVRGSGGQGWHGYEDGSKVPARAEAAQRDETEARMADAARSIRRELGPEISQPDARWIGSWRNDKIVLWVAPEGVMNKVDAGVDGCLADFRPNRNPCPPSRWIGAKNVVVIALHCALTCDWPRHLQTGS